MEWMSVASSMPEDKTPVLVSIDGKYVDLATYSLGRFILTTGREVYPDAWIAVPRPYRFSRHEKGYHARMGRAEKLKKYGIIK